MDATQRYENTLIAILFFTWGTVFLDRMSQLYLAPYFAPEFHLSSEQIGTLASVLAITWAASTFFRRSIGPGGPAASIDSRSVRLLDLVVDVGPGARLPPTAVHARADGHCGRTDVVDYDDPDRGVVAGQPAGTKYWFGSECRCARWSGSSAGIDDASRQPLGLAVGLFCCRHSGIAGWFLDLEVRERAFRKRGDNPPKTICGRVLFPAALSQHLVMLSGCDRFYVVVVCIERIRAALHYRSGASAADHGGVFVGRERTGQFFSGLSSAFAF